MKSGIGAVGRQISVSAYISAGVISVMGCRVTGAPSGSCMPTA